ncbi:MAG TPA: DUF6468 domain-containing protein [Acetobacteraceae bacterium]|nr:DUF6468 domain-containing protein [Acetobacteraceae bacterium]
MEWTLEIVLIGLLAVTLFHAVRLERALGVLKRDRSALQDLVAGFNGATRQAEAGVERLRAAADGAGRQIARQVELGTGLKDDLLFLIERGEKLADRMDQLVRAARFLPEPHPSLSEFRRGFEAEAPAGLGSAERARRPATEPEVPRPRSQAERDLMNALRMAR